MLPHKEIDPVKGTIVQSIQSETLILKIDFKYILITCLLSTNFIYQLYFLSLLSYPPGSHTSPAFYNSLHHSPGFTFYGYFYPHFWLKASSENVFRLDHY